MSSKRINKYPAKDQTIFPFNVGDRVRIKEGIIGVTSIDRGKIYTIERFYDKTLCTIFTNRYDDIPCMSFVEVPYRYYPLRGKSEYWILVEPAKGILPEDLFTL